MALLIRLILMATLIAFPAAAKAPGRATVPAQATASSGGDGPLDISAEESLEWYKDEGLYVARGKARAARGDTVVEADLLTAKKRDGATKEGAGGDMAFLTAEGNVKISDPRQQVFGEKAVYDLDLKTVKVTGPNLKYLTADNVVTARDSLEYFEDKAVAVARGRALAEHKKNRIEADVLTAFFARDKTGALALDHMTAQGQVVVVTEDGGVARAQRGYYDAKKDVVYLMDQVRITRGQTQLAGDKAEVNFATGQSRLLNDGSGRVRALLPSSGEKKESEKESKARP